MAKQVITSADRESQVEAETRRIGRYVWQHVEHRTPSIFERRWWDDHILSWAMADESVKVQMFRFVDVLPMLRTHESVTRHLQEYFEEVRERLPWAVRLGLEVGQPNSILGRAMAINARSNALRMAQRFIAGDRLDDVIHSVARIRKLGLAFTMDLLGEAIISAPEADAYLNSYLNLIRGMAPQVNNWPEQVQIDHDERGPIPRVNVSVKLSALSSRFRPIDPVGTTADVASRLRPLLRCARENSAYVHVDMEQYSYKDTTLDIFKHILMEDEFRDYADVGIVIQAYMPEAEQDLAELLDWVKRRGTPVWIRLVKGAYWDYETVNAQYHEWPIPVYQQKWESDDSFERLTRFLMENYQWLRPALGSHNLRSLAHGIAWANVLEVPSASYEIQMLYGMGLEQARLFTEMGHRVRIYTPFGEMIPGMAYLVRRLLENTSNDSFLRQSFAEDVSIDELLRKPAPPSSDTAASANKPVTTGRDRKATVQSVETAAKEEPVRNFTNEPPTDFSQSEAREEMQAAVDRVADRLGEEYMLIVDGRGIETKGSIVSYNPSHRSLIVGRVASASVDDALAAVDTARRAYREWSRLEPHYRAEYLELAADEMSNRRFEMAAWEVHECGKPWAEADADVAEAIDFLRYYALQMREISDAQNMDVPGEDNALFYRPRGVAVVISPWNFPLAILTGMTAAALVTGNTVIMKPAEQSSVVAAKLMEILQNVGIPPGVVNYVPGVGEEIGPALVSSPHVHVIAFTGSRAVGQEINRRAAESEPSQKFVKRVIAEMGGKNAIIIDDDADLDEAVTGVLYSAFGYAGQKCSACSRVIVLDGVYEAFLTRLKGAVEGLVIGPAEDPGTFVGPVIDEQAVKRIEDYIAVGKEMSRLIVECPVGKLKNEGYYIGPHVFADVAPSSRLGQEEIFGPVLSVMKTRDLSHAIEVANGTDYALTAGIYSRSPANLQRARKELVAGNVYLNRPITGALVERHPFGGFKLSGTGTKAGGPDYLHQFMIPVAISENTMRRGFAPSEE